MKTTRILLKFMAILAMVFCISACSKDDDILTPDVNMGEVVTDFKKAVRYENTKQFLNDRDALSGLILELQGLRWAYWRMASNDFKNDISDFFTVPADELGMNNKPMLTAFNKIFADTYEHTEEFDAAIRHMSALEILPPMAEDEQTSHTNTWRPKDSGKALDTR